MLISFFGATMVLVLLVIGALALVTTSFLLLLNAHRRRSVSVVMRVVGFWLLALAVISPGLSFINSLISAWIVATGAILITTGYVLLRLQRTAGQPMTATKIEDGKVIKPISVLGKNQAKLSPSKLTTARPQRPERADSAVGSAQKQQKLPAEEKSFATKSERRAIQEDTGLRTEPLVHLPTQRRRKVKTFINTVVGFVIFFLVGWGSYVIAKRVIKPQPTVDVTAPRFIAETTAPAADNESTQPSPSTEQANKEEGGKAAANEAGAEPQTEAADLGSAQMVTIRETETGWLNVREGASTATPIITKINPGETYEWLEENEDGTWYKIMVDEDTAGWINVKYAQKNEN